MSSVGGVVLPDTPARPAHVQLGEVDSVDAAFILDACRRAPAATAYGAVISHLEIMMLRAERTS